MFLEREFTVKPKYSCFWATQIRTKTREINCKSSQNWPGLRRGSGAPLVPLIFRRSQNWLGLRRIGWLFTTDFSAFLWQHFSSENGELCFGFLIDNRGSLSYSLYKRERRFRVCAVRLGSAPFGGKTRLVVPGTEQSNLLTLGPVLGFPERPRRVRCCKRKKG